MRMAPSVLDEHVVLRPAEGGAVLHDGKGAVAELQVEKQHVVLIPELFPLVGHVPAGHGHLGGGAHDELDAVQRRRESHQYLTEQRRSRPLDVVPEAPPEHRIGEDFFIILKALEGIAGLD